MMSAEVVKRGIVKTITHSTVSRLLKEAKIKPHLSRYWLNAQPEDEAAFDAQVRAVCALYRQATQLHTLGIHLVCNRIANFEVATGRIVAPSVGPQRTEADFLAHIQQTIAQVPQDLWLFIVDNLNTHQSASLVE
jgi:hypothetical protein